jgi:hypothetical protein
LCRIIDFAALFVFKDLTAFSFRRFRSMRFPCPERAEIWRSTPPRVMPAKAAYPALRDLDSRVRGNDKDAGRAISYDHGYFAGGRFANECLSPTSDLAS